jgi:hypothetical protein
MYRDIMTPVLNMSANSSGLGSIMEESFHIASARSGHSGVLHIAVTQPEADPII